jgi:hypothetical protein
LFLPGTAPAAHIKRRVALGHDHAVIVRASSFGSGLGRVRAEFNH